MSTNITETAAPSDPIVALGERRRALYAEAARLAIIEDRMTPGSNVPAYEHKEAKRAVEDAWDCVGEVEDRMMATPATSVAGIVEQVDILRDFVSLTKYEPLIDTVIAGLRAIAAGGVA